MVSFRLPLRLLGGVLLTLGVLVSRVPEVRAQAAKPRLIVLISIDQFRADYLTRFEDLFLPVQSGSRVGGFRYLMERGAHYPDAHHDHLPLATGPGHSIHFTGAPPYKSGIVGNDWYDRTKKADVYCVQDDNSPLVGTDAKGIGISPDHLRVTTVGDELKMASGGRSKVFGIALKDRAAVLMAGHLADGVYWYDENTGGWITSRYYRKDGTLPAWVSAINAAKVPHSYLGKKWELSVPTDALARLWKPNGGDASKYVDDRNGIGTAFPHTLGAGQTTPGKDLFRAFTNTPFANAWVFDSAERCIREEKLGQDDIPDILAINLSSNDYIGHSFGPDSAEVLDVTVQTDRQLSDFLNRLARDVPGGLNSVTIVLTADHGAPPVPLLLQDSGIRGGIWKGKDVEKAAKDALVKELGEGDWVIEYQEPYLWLNHDALKQKNIDRARAERIASEAITQLDGIYAAYPRSKVLSGEIARTRITDHVTLGFHPLVSGDIALVSLPFFMPRGSLKGETHAEPYTYDDRVPLIIAGAGIRPGTYTERVSTLDIAPTLSFLAHVQQPSGCEGRILSRALLADGAKK